MVAADILITRIADAIVANNEDKIKLYATESATARENDRKLGLMPEPQDSSRRYTRDKHQGDHPSRTADKLRSRKDWKDKKFGGKGNRKRDNKHADQD